MDKDAAFLAIGTITGEVILKSPIYGKTIQTLKHTQDCDSHSAICMKWQKPRKEGLYSSHLLIARTNGFIQMYDSNVHNVINNTSYLVDIGCHLRSVDFNSDITTFMAGGTDKNTYLFDSQTFNPIATFTHDHMHVENTGKITCIKANPDDPNLFVVGSMAHAIYLYDARANGAYACLKGPNIVGESIDIHGDIIVTGSYRHSSEMELFSLSM